MGMMFWLGVAFALVVLVVVLFKNGGLRSGGSDFGSGGGGDGHSHCDSDSGGCDGGGDGGGGGD